MYDTLAVEYLALGVIGFLLGYAFELVTLRRIGGAKPFTGVLAIAMIGYSTAMVALTPQRLWLPGWLHGLGWALLPIAGALIAYSLFVELPFSGTYLRRGPGATLVTTGTYALVRHPTVLFYGILLFSLFLVSPSALLLMAIPLWLLLDVLWAFLQERLLLGREFPEYALYRQRTPAFIPTAQSIVRCLKSFSRPEALKRPMERGR